MQLLPIHNTCKAVAFKSALHKGNFKPHIVDFDYYSVIIKLDVPTKPEDGPPHTSNEPFSIAKVYNLNGAHATMRLRALSR
jgi:hypothetical protein